MADLTISFQFTGGDIQYALDGGEFQPLEEKTEIVVDFDSQVTFEAKTDIRKITNIIVNEQKKVGRSVWRDMGRNSSADQRNYLGG